MPAGYGGQILMTRATEELVRDQLPEGVSLCDLGQHHFRDLSHPEQIFQVDILDLPHEFPPLKSLNYSPNNLTNPVTSFIGRVKELAQVKSLLTRHRLVTLTGPGGKGNTRLALESGSETLDTFPDGVWLVELDSLTDPDLIEKNIANVLHVREQPHLLLQDLLIEVLRSKEILIVLDNCDQLIGRCALIADYLLKACPHLHILVSSREPLAISGEVIYRVPSLSLPPEEEKVSLEEIGGSESVCLFVERAVAVNPLFSLTSQNASAVAQICRRLDDIPLAVELAAARTQLLSVEQIATRLDDRFHLLTKSNRTALPRQKTLRALIDWSYDLLSEAERDLLGQLSVFSGGWSIKAAEAVCHVESEAVLLLLDQLINKSLVTTEQQESEVRYRMLETIRQYAQEKLSDRGAALPVRNRHLEFFSAFSKEVTERLDGSNDIYWMKKLEDEIDNFRSALEWGLDRNPALAVQIASDLVILRSRRGYGSEGLRWLQDTLEKLTSRKEEIPKKDYLLYRARALTAQGVILSSLGENQQAARLFRESVHIFREIKDTDNIGLPR